MNLTPLAAVCRNPLQGIKPEDRIVVRIGTRIRELEPESSGGLIVCRFNGEWLLREHWGEVVRAGDRIEWYEYPQGREGIRLLLQAALVVAAIWFPAAVPYLAAINFAYNVLVPPRLPQTPQQATPGSVYGTSLAGNAARLDQPIWRNCGRVKITPPFACQPYTEFLPTSLDTPYLNTAQYYYVVLSIGVGQYDVEKAFIGKTPVAHFQDVLRAAYLAPGVQPTTARANVVTSDEVSASLEMPEGVYVGGYIASRPGDMVTEIGIDVGANQGLGVASTDPVLVEWQVEAREVNEFGRPIGAWAVIGTESRNLSTNTPQRWSNIYTLTVPMRPEVRVVRTNIKNTAPEARDGIQWIGMRAYLEREATLNPDSAHFEIVMRASDQLSSFSQRDFSMIVRALVRTWDPDTGWSAAQFTRNAMWYLADLWTNEVWGEGLPDDRIDLQGLWDIAQTLDARQDHFDYSFTSAHDSWEAAQLIAHSGRCRAFRRGGVYTIARDELVDVPTFAISSRNTEPKSMTIHASLPRRESPDGIVIEYQSNVTWDTATEECPCPGFSAFNSDSPFYDTTLPVMQNPVYIGLDGVTGRMHALREGIYQAANMAYRTLTVSAKVELEGIVCSFMDPVRWQPQLPGYGITGDVAKWTPGTLTMELTEPADFTGDPPYLTLQRDDGTLTDPVAILPGPTVCEVTLPAAPDFSVTTKDGLRERTKFLLGPLTSGDELVKLSAISDGGKTDGAQMFDLEGLVDDDRVHEADNALLPGPGEIQDPIDGGDDFGDDDGGGTFIHARLTTHFFREAEGRYQFTFTLDHSGVFSYAVVDPVGPSTVSSGSWPHEWLAFPAEPADVNLFEVRLSLFPSGTASPPIYSGTFASWVPFSGGDVVFGFDGGEVGADVVYSLIQIEIRRIGDPAVQATGYLDIQSGHIVI